MAMALAISGTVNPYGIFPLDMSTRLGIEKNTDL
jgi:hypothetical protein